MGTEKVLYNKLFTMQGYEETEINYFELKKLFQTKINFLL